MTETVKAENAKSVIKPCTCSQFSTAGGATTGCTKTTLREFAPGHDAKLKTFLIKAGIAGEMVTWTLADGHPTSGQADAMAAKFKFGYMVSAGIQRAKDKAAEKAARKAEREAAKAAKKAPKVTAKVGRVTYTGRIDGDAFVYEVGGKERRTTKHTVIEGA